MTRQYDHGRLVPLPDEMSLEDWNEIHEGLESLHYDYLLQCWVQNGRVKKCGHREVMPMCYACTHAGERVEEREDEDHG